jgi:hypothetical protein
MLWVFYCGCLRGLLLDILRPSVGSCNYVVFNELGKVNNHTGMEWTGIMSF